MTFPKQKLKNSEVENVLIKFVDESPKEIHVFSVKKSETAWSQLGPANFRKNEENF